MSLYGTTQPKKKGMSKRALIGALLAIALVSGSAVWAVSSFLSVNITANITQPTPNATIPTSGITITSVTPTGSIDTLTNCPSVAAVGTGSTAGSAACTMALQYNTGGVITILVYGNQVGENVYLTAVDTSTGGVVQFGPGTTCNPTTPTACSAIGTPYTSPTQVTSATSGASSSTPLSFTVGFNVVLGTGTSQSDNIQIQVYA